MKVALVIPAHNEEKNIQNVIKKSASYVDWVIIVNDGSSDATKKICEANRCDKKIILLNHKINLGKGSALKTGCEAARKLGSDIIVTIDGDGQHSPEYIPKILQYMESNKLDFIFTVRQGGDKMPLIRFLGNRTLNLTAQCLFNVNLKDMWCGFRAFRVSCLPKISWSKSDYSGEIQMALKVGKNKITYGEYAIPTIYSDNVKGVHILHGLKLLLQMIVWRIML